MRDNDQSISVINLILAVIMWILTACWIVVIFKFSAEDASQSSYASHTLLLYLREHLFGMEMDEYILRKLAHITEFAILTILAFLALYLTNKISDKTSYAESKIKLIKSDNEMYIGLTLWLCSFAAVLDEYHQLFVYGRSGSITDVLVDLIGIISVLLIIRIIFTINLRRLGKEEVRYE